MTVVSLQPGSIVIGISVEGQGVQTHEKMQELLDEGVSHIRMLGRVN